MNGSNGVASSSKLKRSGATPSSRTVAKSMLEPDNGDDPPDNGEVAFDLRPQSCRNPINPRAGGVLPPAILGTANLDVSSKVAVMLVMITAEVASGSKAQTSAEAMSSGPKAEPTMGWSCGSSSMVGQMKPSSANSREPNVPSIAERSSADLRQ